MKVYVTSNTDDRIALTNKSQVTSIIAMLLQKKEVTEINVLIEEDSE